MPDLHPRLRALIGPALVALILGAVPTAQAKVLATVNGGDITDEDVAAAATDLGPNLPEQLEGADRQKYVLDYLVDLKLVSDKATADKAVSDADLARALAYYREKVMMEGMLTKVAAEAKSDASMHKLYDEAKARQPAEDEVQARHILVPTEDEAKAALARVKGGEDFAKVAKDVSKDPGSEGGELGWFTKDKMVPEFANAAFGMKTGDISNPVKSQFGWHVIQVEGRRAKAFPAFDDVKDQLAKYVVQKAQTELITQLRADGKVQRFDAPPAAAAAPAAPAPTK